ncbi:MAG: hypothetical protein ACREMY_15645, partial [bacterium]
MVDARAPGKALVRPRAPLAGSLLGHLADRSRASPPKGEEIKLSQIKCATEGCGKTFRASGVGASYHAQWTGHEVPSADKAVKATMRRRNRTAKRRAAKVTT